MKILGKSVRKGLIAISAIMLSATIVSCSDNDGNEPDPNQPGSQFLGGWEGEMGNFIFFTNNYAKLFKENDYDAWTATINWGVWQYNEESSILATDINNWQFYVTLNTNDIWGGMSLNNNRTYSFERLREREFLYSVMRGAKLITTVDGETYEGNIASKTYGVRNNNSSSYVNETMCLTGYKTLYLYITYQSKDDDELVYELYTYNREGAYYTLYNFECSGKVKVKNRYSATDLTIELTPNDPNAKIPAMTLTIDNVNHK